MAAKVFDSRPNNTGLIPKCPYLPASLNKTCNSIYMLLNDLYLNPM